MLEFIYPHPWLLRAFSSMSMISENERMQNPWFHEKNNCWYLFDSWFSKVLGNSVFYPQIYTSSKKKKHYIFLLV